MLDIKKFFFKKKILIYGLGETGLSSYNFLRKNNDLYLYDDNKYLIKNKIKKKLVVKRKNIYQNKFDFILLSPGINFKKCHLKNFLKKNFSKIVTDLDVFYCHYFQNKNITITGTNGKSTTARLLFEILKNQKKDVRLVGNIGNPILNEKKITSKTIFVIEASSYQIEYSKIFKANYALILNVSPDHLERHNTFKNYVKSKFKLIKNQTNNDYSFFNVKDKFLKREIKKEKIYSKIVNVDIRFFKRNLALIKNPYFLTEGNQQNLSFIFALTKNFKLKKNKIFKTINKFKGLKFRQQIIFKSKKFTLINDSKATSYASSLDILKSLKKVFWIIGGIPKKGDKFLLSKKDSLNIKAYIFGIDRNYFIRHLKNKVKSQVFKNLEQALKKIVLDIKLEKNDQHKTILFSPSAASFDSFKNFEDRGKKFNLLVKKLKIKKLIYD